MEDNVVNMNTEKKKKKFKFPGKGFRYGLIVLVLLFAMTSASQCFVRVSEQEQAVITMFGKVVDVKGAGLYPKIPYLQHVTMVDTTTKGMPIGYRLTDENTTGYNSDYETIEREAIMITSDFNFVDVDFYIEYRVADPVTYLYASADPVATLKNLTQASIRATVARYVVDDVMTTGKGQIQSEVRANLEKKLSENDLGIEIVNVSIQDADPPTDAVMTAFKAVENAKQGKDTSINNAKQYQNEKLPAAEAQADKIIQQAEASKQARIAEAEGQVERFNQMYEEYKKYPLITKRRMFYEAMEDVYPSLKIIITDGSTETMLPLESFTGDTGTGTATTTNEQTTAGTAAETDGE